MDSMYLQIISPKKIYFDGECKMLEYNTVEGYVGILPGHIAMTQIIAPGVLNVYVGDEIKKFALHSGLVKIMPDMVMLLAEVCEEKSEIDVEQAKEAKQKAEEMLSNKLEGFDLQKAERALKKANVRLEVANI